MRLTVLDLDYFNTSDDLIFSSQVHNSRAEHFDTFLTTTLIRSLSGKSTI